MCRHNWRWGWTLVLSPGVHHNNTTSPYNKHPLVSIKRPRLSSMSLWGCFSWNSNLTWPLHVTTSRCPDTITLDQKAMFWRKSIPSRGTTCIDITMVGYEESLYEPRGAWRGYGHYSEVELLQKAKTAGLNGLTEYFLGGGIPRTAATNVDKNPVDSIAAKFWNSRCVGVPSTGRVFTSVIHKAIYLNIFEGRIIEGLDCKGVLSTLGWRSQNNRESCCLGS